MRTIVVVFSLCRDWELLPRDRSAVTGPAALELLPQKLDTYSEAALEYAFRLQDGWAALGEPSRVWAVTPEGELPETIVRNLFAVGAARVILLDGTKCFSDPAGSAAGLARLVDRVDWSALLVGWQDSTVCQSTLGPTLARMLGVPCVGPLSDLWPEVDGLHLVRTLPEYSQQALINGPAVFAMGNSVHPYLRMATLREKLTAAGQTAERCTAPDTLPALSTLVNLSPRSTGRTLSWLKGQSPREQAASLLSAIHSCTEEGYAP